MNNVETFATLSKLLPEIRKTADEAFKLSEARRIQEQRMAEEALVASEQRRIVERDHSEVALDLSEQRRLTERSQSDKVLLLSEKRRITERENSETAIDLQVKRNVLETSLLHEENNKLSQKIIQIIQGMQETCLIFDSGFRLLYVNEHAENLYWPEVDITGKTLNELFPHDVSARVLKNNLSGNIANSIFNLESNDFRPDTCFKFSIHQADDGFLVFLTDITKEKQTELELIRLERLNLSGQIACGISHEIRNPMTTVRGYLQVLKSKKELNSYNKYLDLMIEEIDRANAIITDFLSISKNDASSKALMNLNDIISRQMPLLETSALCSNHIFTTELQEVPDIYLDEPEIRQVLLNIFSNAMEATPSGKIIKILTYVAADSVVLSIANEGEQIKEDILQQMGTPFFTTKDTGTGLGLSICYRIAERHGASISIESTPQQTVFTVRFPIIQ